MGGTVNTNRREEKYILLVGEPEGQKTFERLMCKGSIILKCIVRR
jgi:hypothetical protein